MASGCPHRVNKALETVKAHPADLSPVASPRHESQLRAHHAEAMGEIHSPRSPLMSLAVSHDRATWRTRTVVRPSQGAGWTSSQEEILGSLSREKRDHPVHLEC